MENTFEIHTVKLLDMAVKEYMNCDTESLFSAFSELNKVIKKKAIEYTEFYPEALKDRIIEEIKKYKL